MTFEMYIGAYMLTRFECVGRGLLSITTQKTDVQHRRRRQNLRSKKNGMAYFISKCIIFIHKFQYFLRDFVDDYLVSCLPSLIEILFSLGIK